MTGRETTIRLSVADNFSTQLRAFARALDTSEQSVKHLSTSQQLLKTASQGASDMLMGMGVVLPTSPMMAFGEAIKFSVDAAMAGEVAYAKTEAVIKSTGGTAGYTADEITKMAEHYSDLTGVSHDVIQSAEGVMLTFTAIGHDKFPQAMEAAQNLSAALGTDLQSAVIQVGKALQDPIGGLTALRRVGVNFNEAAKETVKHLVDMGDTAGAQAFILKELNTEFGGMAEKLGNTTQGKINKTKDALDRLGESIGSHLLPILGKAADAATILITWQDKLTEAYAGTAVKITEQSTEYADYKSSLEATARAAGLITDQFVVGQGYVTKYSDSFKELTEAQWNAVRGAYGLNGALDESNRAARRAAESAKQLASDEADASQSSKELQKDQKALGEYYSGVTDRAISYADSSRKLIDLQQQLSQVDSDIAARGPAYIATVNKKTMGAAERSAKEGELTALLKEQARVEANKKPGDQVHLEHLAKLEGQVNSTRDALSTYNATMGGATKEQLKNRQAILDQIDALTLQDNKSRAMEGVKALESDLKDGTLTIDQYNERMNALNRTTGLMSQADLDASLKQQAFLQVLSDPNKSVSEITQAILSYNTALNTQYIPNTDTAITKTATLGQTAADRKQAIVDLGDSMTNAGKQSHNAAGDVYDLVEEIRLLKDKSITITTHLKDVYDTPIGGAGHAHSKGANFIVPPGYEGDNFPLGSAQSGERVIIIPRGQSNQSTTNNQFSMNVYTSNPASPIQEFGLMRALAGAM